MVHTEAPPAGAPPRNGLFRQQAVDSLSAPSDQLDKLLRVTSPRGWLALLALAAVVLAAILYGFLGSLPTTVSGQGLFLPPGGLTRIDATAAGAVSGVTVAVGDPIAEGDPVATITPGGGPAVTVASPVTGTVTEVLTERGSFVSPGTELAVVEPQQTGITAVVFIPAGQGKAIEVGMVAQLSPSTAPSEQFGQAEGVVTSVSEFPVSSERLTFVLQDDILVDEISMLGSALEVTIKMSVDPGTDSGLVWTSGDGPPFLVHNGTLTTVSVILGEESPAKKLFDPRE